MQMFITFFLYNLFQQFGIVTTCILFHLFLAEQFVQSW